MQPSDDMTVYLHRCVAALNTFCTSFFLCVRVCLFVWAYVHEKQSDSETDAGRKTCTVFLESPVLRR